MWAACDVTDGLDKVAVSLTETGGLPIPVPPETLP
jgi:hypothetical protein